MVEIQRFKKEKNLDLRKFITNYVKLQIRQAKQVRVALVVLFAL